MKVIEINIPVLSNTISPNLSLSFFRKLMSIDDPLVSQPPETGPLAHKRFLFVTFASILCVLFCARCLIERTEVVLSTLTELGIEAQSNFDRPIVGILSLALSEEFRKAHHMNLSADTRAVIPASYVKWLQSAGAQVVVIPHFWDLARVSSLVGKLSAVLFTGGDYGDKDWNATTSWIFKEAVRRSETSDQLALWGTCLGFERIMQVASQDEIGTVVKASLVDNSVQMKWTKSAEESRIYQFMGKEDIARFSELPIAYNYHTWGVTPESWGSHAALLDPLFNIVGMHEYNGTKFVAMVEGKKGLPVWGVQFHPEKALFEWSPNLNYPHSEAAILANRKLSDFLIGQIRRINKISSVGFDSFGEESSFAIYNYRAVFTGVDVNATTSIYTETYIIDKYSHFR